MSCAAVSGGKRLTSLISIMAMVAAFSIVTAHTVIADHLPYDGSDLWNGMNRIVVDDTLGYAAMAYGVQVFDLKDPSNPRAVSQLFLENESAVDIAILPGPKYVAVITGDGRTLHLVNIVDPLSPVISRSYLLPERAFSLTTDREVVAVGCSRKLFLINVYNPTELTGKSYDIPIDPLDIAIRGNIAFIVGYGYLYSIRIKQDTAITLDSLATGFYPVALSKSPDDSLIYVADLDPIWPGCQSAFTIVNGADSSNLRILGRYPLSGSAEHVSDVAVNGSYAFVSSGYAGTQVLDISDPTSPDSITTIPTNYFANNIALSQNLALVIDRVPFGTADLSCFTPSFDPPYPPLGFAIYDVTDPRSPTLAGRFDLPSRTDIMVRSESTMVTASQFDYDASVRIFDVDRPGQLQLLSTLTPAGTTEGLLIQDSLLFICNNNSNLDIYSIADRTSPHLLGQLSTGQSTGRFGMAVRMPYLYLSAFSPSVRIMDISNPALPSELASCNVINAGRSVALSGDYLYVGTDSSLGVVDISDPALAQYVCNVGDSQYDQLVISDNRLVARGPHGFDLFSLADPSAPQLVHHCALPSLTLTDICVRGDFVYLACGDSGIRMAMIANTDTIRIIGSFDTQGSANSITVDSSGLIVGDSYGILYLNIDEPVSVDESIDSRIPNSFSLFQNYPNPFNPLTTIEYYLPRRTHVEIAVYNIAGQRVKILVSKIQATGRHSVQLSIGALASGVYFYQLVADGVTQGTKKMLLLK